MIHSSTMSERHYPWYTTGSEEGRLSAVNRGQSLLLTARGIPRVVSLRRRATVDHQVLLTPWCRTLGSILCSTTAVLVVLLRSSPCPPCPPCPPLYVSLLFSSVLFEGLTSRR